MNPPATSHAKCFACLAFPVILTGAPARDNVIATAIRHARSRAPTPTGTRSSEVRKWTDAQRRPGLVGGGLAVAGATLQALLRNPLAEPYILGISGGAALGAVMALAGGWISVNSLALPLAAFAGALLAIGLVFGVAFSGTRRMDVGVLLLAGVVVGAFFQACVALVLTLAEANTIRSALLWMMGSIDGASWGG